jgi:hypothetical protein
MRHSDRSQLVSRKAVQRQMAIAAKVDQPRFISFSVNGGNTGDRVF